MKRIIHILFILIIIVVGVTTTLMQAQPALFWINIFAPHNGDTFNIKLVALLTILSLLLPYIIVLIILKLIRKGKDGNAVVVKGQTGIYISRKKQLQSFLMGLPVLINGSKAGLIDSGKNKFFAVPSGMLSVQIGEGKPASEKIEIRIKEGEQFDFTVEISQSGLGIKYNLKQIPVL